MTSTNLASVVYQDNLYNGPGLPLTSGFTTQLSPDTYRHPGCASIGLNPSPKPITTIASSLGPGRMVTFFTLHGGSVTFQPGRYIDLMGMTSLMVTGTVTFVRTDLGGPLWKVVSQWNDPMP